MLATTTWTIGGRMRARHSRTGLSLVAALALAAVGLAALAAGGLYVGGALLLGAALATIDGCQRGLPRGRSQRA